MANAPKPKLKKTPLSSNGIDVLYNGRRIKIIEYPSTHPRVLGDEFTIEIFDKKILSEVGNAKRLDDGTYRGFIVCGMHELTISGDNLRELAQDAYQRVLEAEKY